jgi:hypothetical protein
MKILPVGTELFHADRRTDRRHEADSRFSQVYGSAWNWSELHSSYRAVNTLRLGYKNQLANAV